MPEVTGPGRWPIGLANGDDIGHRLAEWSESPPIFKRVEIRRLYLQQRDGSVPGVGA
jgi:hypothetical protein